MVCYYPTVYKNTTRGTIFAIHIHIRSHGYSVFYMAIRLFHHFLSICNIISNIVKIGGGGGGYVVKTYPSIDPHSTSPEYICI